MSSLDSVKTINPATGQPLREFALLKPSEVEELLAGSLEAFEHWRKLELKLRLSCLETFENALSSARSEMATRMTDEMGKVHKESLGEVDKCLLSCKYIRENFSAWKEHHEAALPNGYSVHYQPLGPLVGIMPWNFPLWQVVRFAIPALLNGNTILLKHAPSTWGSAELMEDIFRQAFPDGVYAGLQVDVPTVEKILADPRIRGVSLTGSRRAGQSVGKIAGEHLKKCVLELGGSDPYVVLDDADVVLAADVCAKSRLINAGQSCVSAKRFIVTKRNVARFTEAFQANLGAAKWGDPYDSTTTIGPMARKDLRDGLATQVKKSIAQGAKLLLGGETPNHAGYFYPPTLLAGVQPGQVAFDEELFGPVAAVIEANDEKHALQLANRSVYGLGGAIFSRDIERARQLAVEDLDSGMVAVNDFIRSDASSPFGGVKDSGLGRELGREGSFEFVNVKSVYLKP